MAVLVNWGVYRDPLSFHPPVRFVVAPVAVGLLIYRCASRVFAGGEVDGKHRRLSGRGHYCRDAPSLVSPPQVSLTDATGLGLVLTYYASYIITTLETPLAKYPNYTNYAK